METGMQTTITDILIPLYFEKGQKSAACKQVHAYIHVYGLCLYRDQKQKAEQGNVHLL